MGAAAGCADLVPRTPSLGPNGRHVAPKNRVDEPMEAVVVGPALDFPAHGPVPVGNALRKRDVFISGIGVRCVWPHHRLSTTKGPLREEAA